MTITFDQGEDSTLSTLCVSSRDSVILFLAAFQPSSLLPECPRVRRKPWKRRLTLTTFEGTPKTANRRKLAADRLVRRSLKQMGLVLLSSSTRPITFQAATTARPPRRSAVKTDVAGKKLKKKVPGEARRAASAAAWTDYLGYATIAASAIGLVGIVWSSYQQK